MKHSHPFENKYCTGCQSTTRHEVKDKTFSCLRCGAVKYPIAVRMPVSANAELKNAVPVCA